MKQFTSTGIVEDLREQGFRVEPRSSGGVAVYGQNGEGPKFFHPSTFDHGVQSARNIIAELRTMGWQTPEEREAARHAARRLASADREVAVAETPAPPEPDAPPQRIVWLNANEARVYLALKASMPKGTSRLAVAKASGVAGHTVTSVMRHLKDEGLARTTGATVSTVYFAMAPDDVVLDISESSVRRNQKGGDPSKRAGTRIPALGALDSKIMALPTAEPSDADGMVKHPRRKAGPVRTRQQRPQSVDVRVRNALKTFRSGLELIQEAMDALEADLAPMLDEYHQAVSKRKDVEKRVDDLLEAL